jgi:FKBP-type peptidyl-prolyl cis-trans isomerase
MPFRFFSPFLLSLLIPVISCGPEHPVDPPHKKVQVINKDSIKNQFIRANRQVVQKENDEMDYYATSHQMPFVKTSSGIRYYVYKPSVKGDSIKDNSIVTLKYKVSLLDGTECYSSKTDGPKTFRMDRMDLESGIHMALFYLKRGDKALVLIPSHLAHGLLGDFKKIPPQMPIVYDIEVQ